MITVLSDEEYVTLEGFMTKEKCLLEFGKILNDGYTATILPNGYLHVYNQGGKVLQWRRKFSPRAKLYIPKILVKVKELQQRR
jgi:hypothetical protein